MALTDSDGNLGATMLVSPTGNNGGFGGFGNDGGIWLILLFILLAGGNGFGNNGYGNNGGLYPWLNNSQNINDGFREQMLNDNVTSIRDGIFGISTTASSASARSFATALPERMRQSQTASHSPKSQQTQDRLQTCSRTSLCSLLCSSAAATIAQALRI